MPTSLRHHASQAIFLLLTCITLIGHEITGLSEEHEECIETVCAVCGGFNEGEPTAAGPDAIRLAAHCTAVRKKDYVPGFAGYANFSAASIRAPPILF